MEKLKKILNHLKHVIKDPISTIAEADQRKKELLPLLYISIGVTVVPALLGSLISALGFLMIFAFIGFIGVALFGFLLFVVSKAKKKFEAMTCSGCNTMISAETKEAFDKYVSYEILSATTKLNSNISKDGKNELLCTVSAKGKGTVVAQVSFKCPECGKVNSFKYTIEPFKCEKVEEKVTQSASSILKLEFDKMVNKVLDAYDPNDTATIPMSIHSVYHPDHEAAVQKANKPQLISHPEFEGVTITYHRTPTEMIEGLFIRNELNGKIEKQ